MELFLSIGTVVFFAIFAIRPTLLTMSELIKEIDDKKELNTQLEQKVASLSSVQTIYNNLENRLFLIDQAIPSQPQVENVLKLIEKVASEEEIVISTIQLKEIPKDSSADVTFEQKSKISVPINVSVIGDYQAIKNFTQRIISLRRALVIDSIIFSVSEERGVKKLQANITINMQYFGVENANSK